MKSLFEFYKLGDKYSSDFDYDGMLKLGSEAKVSMGLKKLKQLFNSFEDVNYHSEAQHLSMAISELESGDKKSAEDHLKKFREDCKNTLGVNENLWPLLLITMDDVEKLSNGEEIVLGGYKIKVVDDPDDESIHAFVDLDEGILFEKRIRQTRRMKNSNKVVAATTKELFGPEGKYEAQVKKIFKLFKAEVRRKAKELGVPVGAVRQWKITLKDYDNSDIGTKI